MIDPRLVERGVAAYEEHRRCPIHSDCGLCACDPGPYGATVEWSPAHLVEEILTAIEIEPVEIDYDDVGYNAYAYRDGKRVSVADEGGPRLYRLVDLPDPEPEPFLVIPGYVEIGGRRYGGSISVLPPTLTFWLVVPEPIVIEAGSSVTVYNADGEALFSPDVPETYVVMAGNDLRFTSTVRPL